MPTNKPRPNKARTIKTGVKLFSIVFSCPDPLDIKLVVDSEIRTSDVGGYAGSHNGSSDDLWCELDRFRSNLAVSERIADALAAHASS